MSKGIKDPKPVTIERALNKGPFGPIASWLYRDRKLLQVLAAGMYNPEYATFAITSEKLGGEGAWKRVNKFWEDREDFDVDKEISIDMCKEEHDLAQDFIQMAFEDKTKNVIWPLMSMGELYREGIRGFVIDKPLADVMGATDITIPQQYARLPFSTMIVRLPQLDVGLAAEIDFNKIHEKSVGWHRIRNSPRLKHLIKPSYYYKWAIVTQYVTDANDQVIRITLMSDEAVEIGLYQKEFTCINEHGMVEDFPYYSLFGIMPTVSYGVGARGEQTIEEGITQDGTFKEAEEWIDSKQMVTSSGNVTILNRIILNSLFSLNHMERTEEKRIAKKLAAVPVDTEGTSLAPYHPTEMKLVQTVVLKQAKNVVAAAYGEARGEMRPHLRRGHWRHQRHGEKNKKIKMVWMAPTIVRADRLANPTGAARGSAYIMRKQARKA